MFPLGYHLLYFVYFSIYIRVYVSGEDLKRQVANAIISTVLREIASLSHRKYNINLLILDNQSEYI